MQNRFVEKQENGRSGSLLFGKATRAKASGLAFSFAAVLPTGLSVVLLLLLQSFGLAQEGYTEKQWYLYLSYLITPTAFFLTAVWYFLFLKGSFVKSVKRQNCKPIYYLIALLLQIGLFSLSQANTWFIEFLSRFGYKPTDISLPSMGGWGFVGVVLAIAVLPAIFEEIIFRGILLDGLQCFGKVGAVLLCGALFALYHQNPMQTIYQFCCGAAFALVALKSGSVLPTILAHFLNNYVILFLTKFGITSFSMPVAIAIICVSAVCLIGAMAYLILDKQGEESYSQPMLIERKKERRRFGIFSAAGIAILVIVWIANLFVGIQG